MGTNHIPLTDEAKQAFLDEFRKHGIQTPALRSAGISYTGFRHALKDDLEFADAVEHARSEAADNIESAAYERAVMGVERQKVIGSGESAMFITERHYSDPLLAKLLDGVKPEKYAQRTKSEISTPVGQPFEVNDTASAARLAAIFDAASRRKAAASEDIDPFS